MMLKRGDRKRRKESKRGGRRQNPSEMERQERREKEKDKKEQICAFQNINDTQHQSLLYIMIDCGVCGVIS